MAKITELPAAGALTGAEPILVVQGGASKKASIGALVDAATATATAGANAAAATATTKAAEAAATAATVTIDTVRSRLESALADITKRRGALDVTNRLYHPYTANTGSPSIDYRGVGTFSNADGNRFVITIPAGEYISVDLAQIPEAVTLPLNTITAMVIEASLVPSGTIAMQYRYAASAINGGGAYSLTYSPAQANPKAGIYTRGFQNTGNGATIANGSPRLFIQNTGGSAVKIFAPIVVVGDFTGKVPPADFDKRYYPIAAKNREFPVRDFEFWKSWGQDAPERQVNDRNTTKAVSSTGSDAAAGTRHAPKQTLAALHPLATDNQIGLARNSVWRMETLPVGTGVAGVSCRDLSRPGEPLPIISLFEQVANGNWVATGDGTYNFTPAAPTYGAHEDSAALNDDGYNLLPVVAVNLAQEAAGLPYTARVGLVRVTSQALCAATPGSYYAQALGGNQFRRYIRLPDSSVPGTTYRVEVVNKYCPVSWYQGDGRVLSGVHLIGACGGYGHAPMGDDAVIDRFVFMHGTAHATVTKGGLIQRGFIYTPGAKGKDFGPMITFYRADGAGKKGIARQLIFQGVESAFYCHITSGARYSKIDVEDCVAVLGRNPAGALWGQAFASNNTDRVEYRRVYAEGYGIAFGAIGDVGYASVRDSAVINCAFVNLYNVFENNLCRLENFSDAGNVNNRGCRLLPATDRPVSCRNNLLHFKCTNRGVANDNSPAVVISGMTATSPVVFKNNLIILEPPASGITAVPVYMSLPSPGDGNVYLESDYNVIVNLYPANYPMSANGKGTKTTAVGAAFGFRDEAHKFYTNAATGTRSDLITERMPAGSEAHSYYFDLSEDPRGIDAVFVDAANSDYRWADTDIAREIAAACEACDAGPNWRLIGKPRIPTAEEAVELIARA